MILKFLAHGVGDPRKAVAYILSDKDHLGEQRAGVEILRGDPVVFSTIASSLDFKYLYTSFVIAWSSDDQVSDLQRFCCTKLFLKASSAI